MDIVHVPGENPADGPVKNMVLMEGISSREHFWREGEEPRRVIEDINLLIKREEVWGINGSSLFEIRLLLEIMANIRPYDGGRCVLVERGMPRHKRIILQHVFYIGSSGMLYDNMNVLEFLVFAAAGFNKNPVELQEEIFEFILDAGLGHISLTPNSLLTREEKAVVTLLAAAYSGSMMIVFNLPEYEFNEALTGAIEKIAGLSRTRGKAVILSTKNCLLIEKACSHTAFIAGGRIIYQGTVEELRFKFDRVVVILRDKDIHGVKERLAPLLHGCRLSVKGGSLLISDDGEEERDPAGIYKKILEAGIVPDNVEINPKTVQNAY